MYPTSEWRIRELREIIAKAEEEIRQLEWTTQTRGHPSGWFKQEKVCTMPQGHPSHCGCHW